MDLYHEELEELEDAVQATGSVLARLEEVEEDGDNKEIAQGARGTEYIKEELPENPNAEVDGNLAGERKEIKEPGGAQTHKQHRRELQSESSCQYRYEVNKK